MVDQPNREPSTHSPGQWSLQHIDEGVPRSTHEAPQEIISTHLPTAVALKRALNSVTPINRLPNEILGQIMVWRALHEYYSRGSRSDNSSISWIRVTHVCHAWREVALATPMLWANIHYTRTDVFRICLERSKQASLRMTVDVRFDKTDLYVDKVHGHIIEVAAMIATVMPRIVELRVYGAGSLLRVYCKNCSSMGRLKHLVLDDTLALLLPPTADPDFHTQILSVRDHMPSLTELQLRGIPMQWGDPIFMSPLTVLKVATGYRRYDASNMKPIGTLEELLAALRFAAPTLKILELCECIPPIPADLEDVPPPNQVIPFPALESISLLGIADDSAKLLHYMSFTLPTRVRSSVTGRGGSVLGFSALARIMSAHFAGPLHFLHMGSIGWRIDIYGSIKEDHNPDFPDFDFSVIPEPHPQLCRRLMNAFFNGSSSALRSLKMDAPVIYSHINWAVLFARMPQLERLALCRTPSQTFWSALCKVRRLDTGEVDVLLPCLSSLELDNTEFRRSESPGESFVVGLLRWTSLRHQQGFPIKHLRIVRSMFLTRDDATQLRSVVSNVEWNPDIQAM